MIASWLEDHTKLKGSTVYRPTEEAAFRNIAAFERSVGRIRSRIYWAGYVRLTDRETEYIRTEEKLLRNPAWVQASKSERKIKLAELMRCSTRQIERYQSSTSFFMRIMENYPHLCRENGISGIIEGEDSWLKCLLFPDADSLPPDANATQEAA